MLIPAFFVAHAVMEQSAAAGSNFDIVVVVPAGEVTAEQHKFAMALGIVVDDTLDTTRLEGIPILQERLSPATLFKVLLASHFGERYRRILYLDADLTIHGDVGALFELEMGDFALAAVPAARLWLDKADAERERAFAHFKALGMTSPYQYFNTGVLLIHPGNWLRDGIDRRAIAFLKQNPELCLLPDEDALNAVFDGRLLELSPIWNMRIERVRSTAASPVIIHYAGADKPWRRFSRLFEFGAAYRLYAEFIRQTPWPDWLRSQWSLGDLIESIRRELLTCVDRFARPSPLRSPARRAAFEEETRQYYATMQFADVEQGIVVRRNGRLQLA